MNSPVNSSDALSKNALHFSAWLDFFRWSAALLVVFNHVNSRFFVKVLSLPPSERSIDQYVFALVSGFGRPSVMIFFVLSGFLVGGSALKRFKNTGKFDYVDYLLARISRLWTVLLPSFVAVYIFNRIGVDLFDGAAAGVYKFSDENGTVSLAEGPLTFICNAVFLQTAACYQYGGNGALWSLFHEFWYYVVWPLGMIAVWGKVSFAVRVTLLAATAAILLSLAYFQFVAESIAAYYSIWLLGVVAASRTKPFLPLGPWGALASFLIALLVWRFSVTTALEEHFLSIQSLADLGISFVFANMLLTFRGADYVPAPPLVGWHAPLAGFAFSLYCTHMPLINAYGSFLISMTGMGWQMHPKGLGVMPYVYAFSAVAVCVIFAFLFSLVTERHTNKVRNLFVRLRNSFSRKPQTS